MNRLVRGAPLQSAFLKQEGEQYVSCNGRPDHRAANVFTDL